MNIICVNHRGASSRAFSKKSYHSGRGEDAESVILWARKKFQGSKIVAIGFSLSGAIMLNLLTQRYGVQGPDYAIVVNAPLNLFDSSKKLSQGFSKIYDWRFYLNLKKILKAKHQEASQWPYLQKVEYIDEHYTSRVNGFENAEDYYLKCSPVKYLHQIKTPTFVLTSEDDPFVSVEFYRSAQWSDWVHLHIAPSGGHMGYIAKNKIEKFGCRWMDYYISRVLIYLQGFDR